MAKTPGRKRMVWTIVASVLATAVVALLAVNLAPPEKKLEQPLTQQYAVNHPQFRREMSVMLGPAIVAGNRVAALQNGAEIFPAMLEAIRAAKRSITFETYIYGPSDISVGQ